MPDFNAFDLNFPPPPFTFSDSGFIYGIHAGYNWDRGRLVYGIEGDIDFMDGDFSGAFPTPGVFVPINIRLESIARLRLRLGYDLDRAFVYGTAGAAYLDASGGPFDISSWGWVAGAGVDYKLNEDWVAGADALYHEFNNVLPTGSTDVTTYRLRLSYRF